MAIYRIWGLLGAYLRATPLQMIGKRPMDHFEAVFYDWWGYLHITLKMQSMDELQRFVEYAKENIVQLRTSLVEEGGIPHIVMHEDLCPDRIHFYDERVPDDFFAAGKLGQNLPPKDGSVGAELHAFIQPLQVVIIANHAAMDSRYFVAAYNAFHKGTPMPRGMLASSENLLRSEIDRYREQPRTLANSFEVAEPPPRDVGPRYNIREVVEDITALPHLASRFTQRLFIISSVMKLRLLQAQGLLSAGEIVQHLSGGIVMRQGLVLDTRTVIDPAAAEGMVFGNAVAKYTCDFVLRKGQTVREYGAQLTEELGKLNKQKQYLQFFADLDKQGQGGQLQTNHRVIESLEFSSVGRVAADHGGFTICPCCYRLKEPTHYCNVVMTIGTTLRVYMQYPGWMMEYIDQMERWLRTLLRSVVDSATVLELFQALQ